MQHKRLTMVNQLIHHHLAPILQRETQHIQALITITSVETATDLATAKVYVSIYGKKYVQSTLHKLNTMAPHLQYLLGQEIDLRRTPKLRFLNDSTLNEVEKVENLLDQLQEG